MGLHLPLLLPLLSIGLCERKLPFYGSDEKHFREKCFDERVKKIPTGPPTATWEAFTATLPDTETIVVFNSSDSANRWSTARNHVFHYFDQVFLNITQDASRPPANAPGASEQTPSALSSWDEEEHQPHQIQELARRVAEWQGIWRRLSSDLETRLSEEGLLNANFGPPRLQVPVGKVSLAVPAHPASLWKFYPFFLSLRTLSYMPRDLAIAVSPPSTYEELVAYKAFLLLLAEIAKQIPSKLPLVVVTHSASWYKQWGNRWLAANYTSPQSTWVSFFDNDDFLSPERFHWIDQILSTRSEVDVLLLGKFREKTTRYDDMVEQIIRTSIHTQPSKENEAAALSKLLSAPTQDLYNEPLKSMNATWLSEWRVNSIVGAPLWVGRQAFWSKLYDVAKRALKRQNLKGEERKRTELELQYLELVKTHAPGTGWGDPYVQDGWPTIRRAVFDHIRPPTIANWGEDSLYNWMIGASGLNYLHAVPPFEHFRGGTYLHWPHRDKVWQLDPVITDFEPREIEEPAETKTNTTTKAKKKPVK